MVIEMPIPATKEPSSILDTIRTLQKKIAEGREATELLSAIVIACQNGSTVPPMPVKVLKAESMTDQELAKAAGIRLTATSRPDVWRKYLSRRAEGATFWGACTDLRLWRDTARKLDALLPDATHEE